MFSGFVSIWGNKKSIFLFFPPAHALSSTVDRRLSELLSSRDADAGTLAQTLGPEAGDLPKSW